MTTTHTPTSAAYVAVKGSTHAVLDVAKYGEDEHDGLVDVLVEDIESGSHAMFWTTVLAEDIRVAVSTVTALVDTMLWDEAKHG